MNADRMMRNMMQSMGMGMPFGIFGDPFEDHMTAGFNNPMSLMPQNFMSPFPGLMMGSPFQGIQQAMSLANNAPNNGTFSFCSSSVTSYTTDEQGRPQVYQQSQEIKQGPNGIKETKSAVRDSRSGHQELAIGHHIHDKSHIKKKAKNAYSGEEEQTEDFVNLEEAEADEFEQHWAQQARNITSYNHAGHHNQLRYGDRSHNNGRLAITSSDHHRSSTTAVASPGGSSQKTKKEKKKKSKLFKI